ncbi:probable serine/threonine-protein kinase DDB_G0282963 [Bicyclus anynana]|uniref:Probable serine/threonine-protein kinase DDB_G0282963 n=1 Tax=Bicyclus anynana TaxID=110368 RepID=A0ABM3M6U4_BICAN|nr:probable serine/threonine-protein kinase DDB_G0282963 [Bicyclus anynana]
MSFRNYFDSSSTYSKNRNTERTASASERPSTVTAKYTTTPSYKSSSIPVLNDRSTREETPISTIASRYSSYKQTDKPTSKYEKKDYSKLSVPSVTTNRSRDVSPVSTTSKYSLSRTTRTTSPDRRTAKSYKDKCQDIGPVDRVKDIPIKTDKASNYSNLSNYKVYPRSSNYTRPTPRVETKPEITVNRYAIANRLSSSSYLRSPTPIKRTLVSPILINDVGKPETEKPTTPNNIVEEKDENTNKTDIIENGIEEVDNENNETETVTVVTRHTSPTPPGSSAYVRMRRADMAKTIEKIITRARKRPEMIDKEMQSDRLDDPTRSSRFGNTNRTSMTNWTYYSPNVNSYTGYAGRHLTQYTNLSNNTCNDRSSRSRSKEPTPIENKCLSPNTEENEKPFNFSSSEPNEDTVNISVQDQEDDTSEIIINVNLKLKKAKSPPSTPLSNDLISSSEKINSNNNQLPPQPPKSESVTKVRKVKIRKSSTDSSSDSTSSKKVVKKRSKSVSSTDSEQTNDKSSKSKDSSKIPSKNSNKNSSNTSLHNGPTKLKHSKSRESNSPESSITLSTQSSISEDDTVLKKKSNENTLDDNLTKHNLLNKNEGCEEAKSFLIRALAPVTNLFKLRHQDNDEINRTTDISQSDSAKSNTNFMSESGSRNRNNTFNIIASNDDNLVKLKAIRHIESGDRASWLDSDTDKKNTNNDLDRFTELYNDHNSSTDLKHSLKPSCFADDEKPWWLDSNANIPEGIERLSPPRKSSSDSDKLNSFKIRQNESGERKDWRVMNTESSSSVNKQELQNNLSLSKSGSDQRNFPVRRIRHIESGERPWWLSSNKNIPEGIEKLPTPPPQDSDSSDSEEIEVYIPPSHIPPFPLHLPDDEPLGARRSPEGLETPKDVEDYIGGRSSPYENNRQYRRESSNLPYQKGAEKYISRYTDIDDILGTSGQIYSPFMESILARRTGQLPYDDDDCEEIDPTQVRIHDSTAQMPVIKKLRCRSEIIDCRDEDHVS